MGDVSVPVICPLHGKGYATFVCQHLVHGSERGFFYGGDDVRPDAWCDACEQVLLAHGGTWNDASEASAGITLLCSGCYDTVRARNEVPFKRVRPSHRPTLEEDGWELDSAKTNHLLHPATFAIPDAAELHALRVGDMVQLRFLFSVTDTNTHGGIRGERMWVTIEQVTATHYRGRLESEPVTSQVIKPLDTVIFRQDHVAAIFVRRDDPRHPEYGR